MVQHLRIGSPVIRRQGKCISVNITSDDDPFFGTEYGEETGDFDPAVRFCNGTDDGVLCPIRHDCLIFALTNNEKFGVWGGTTPQTRKAIRKQWPLRRGKVPRPEWEWMDEESALEMLTDEDRVALMAEEDD